MTPSVSEPVMSVLRVHAPEVKNKFDVIIIGAGVLGSALAATLGKDGRDVLIIERDWKEPDRIVGELLQPGGVKALTELGLADCLEGIDAIPCDGYAVFYQPEEVVLPYPADKRPNEGRSFHHGKFIMNLRNAARNARNVTIAEGSASALVHCAMSEQIIGCTYSYKDSDGKSRSRNAYAPLTVVADGCFSKFRKEYHVNSVSSKSNFVGFVLRDCKLPYPSHGHVILAKPSPVLLYQIGTHDTRVLIDIPGKLPSPPEALASYLAEHISPQLPADVRPSFLSALKTERLRSMPNSYLQPAHTATEGLILLGDAMNMRHPLTGGGMTVALSDVVRVRTLLSKENVPDLSDTRQVQTRMRKLHADRKPLAAVVNVLAQALYSLFSAGDDPHMKTLQLACFAYFKRGGRCVSTPVGLLGGMIPEPLTLLGHFFAVAFYGIYLVMTGRLDPTGVDAPGSRPYGWTVPSNLWRCIMALYTACIVVLPTIFGELTA